MQSAVWGKERGNKMQALSRCSPAPFVRHCYGSRGPRNIARHKTHSASWSVSSAADAWVLCALFDNAIPHREALCNQSE